MKLVYISSPYTVGDKVENVKRSLRAAEVVYQNGFLPFTPLLSHFWDEISPKSYEYWMEMDLHWVLKADYLLRLSGESAGADLEVRLAKEHNIPVFYSVGDLLFYVKREE